MKAEDVIVASTKEAEQAGQQLIKERETLAEKIQKLKVPFKRMLTCLLYTSPSPRDATLSRMPSSA